MFPSLPVERPKSLTDLAADRIRDAIVTGPLQFGQPVSESVLAGMLGMSKTPVREALLRLRHEGLIVTNPQRGTFVFQLEAKEVADICQFRAVIEGEALAEAMKHRHADLVRALETCLVDMTEALSKNEPGALARLDTDFHDAIVAHCDNGYLKTAYNLIAAQVTALRYRLPSDDEQVNHCQENHGVLVEAIRNMETRKAQSILRAHIQSTRDSYLIARSSVAPPAQEKMVEAG